MIQDQNFTIRSFLYMESFNAFLLLDTLFDVAFFFSKMIDPTITYFLSPHVNF
jgi:hypothetical protein